MPSANQRRSIRLPEPPERVAAELRIGLCSIPGTMVNESAGGFTVRVDGDSPIVVGQVLLLGITSGWSRARVAHTHRDGDGMLVGLQRLCDLSPEWEGGPAGGLWMFDRLRTPRPGGEWSWYLGGALVVFGVILAATIWQVMSTDAASRTVFAVHDRANPRRTPQTGGQPSASRRGAGSPSSGLASRRRESAQRRAGASPGAVERWLARWANQSRQWLGGTSGVVATALPSSIRQTGEQVENLTRQARKSWDQLQDEVVLLLPRVAEKLQLTPDQRTRIETIVRDNRQTVQQVYRQADDKSSPEVWQKIERVRKEAGEEALAQLTTEQREQLVALRTH